MITAATASGLLWLAFVAHAAFDFGGSGLDDFVDLWVYDSLLVVASLSCLVRAAVIPRERAAWTAMGLGLLAWTAGEIYYSAVLSDRDAVPIPSLADGGTSRSTR